MMKHDLPKQTAGPTGALEDAVDVLRNLPSPKGPHPDLVTLTIDTLRAAGQSQAKRAEDHGGRPGVLFDGALPLTLAALALVATVIGLYSVGRAPNVAFDDVVAEVEQVRSVAFTGHQSRIDGREVEYRAYRQGGALRIEMVPSEIVVIADLRQQKAVQIDASAKSAYTFSLDKQGRSFSSRLHEEDRGLSFRRNVQDGGLLPGPEVVAAFADPIHLVNNLGEAELLGEEYLKGRKTIVYRFASETSESLVESTREVQWTVWVDPGTRLPVKVQAAANDRQSASNRPEALWILENFEWNKEYRPQFFSQRVPDGYVRLQDGS